MSDMPVIDLRDVRHDFDGVPVLRGLNLRLSERRIAIIGDNGSGKISRSGRAT